MIKNMAPRLAEHGKIKLGRLGDKRQKKDGSGFYQLPTKLDHFLITTTERDNTGNFIPDLRLMEQIAEKVGQLPDHLTKIPVFLLYDEIDQNFFTTYACYQGRTRICTGDGEKAVVLKTGEEVACPCPRLDQDYKGPTPCKPYGRLSVLIQEMNSVGSVWVFRTTGWNSVQDILGSLALVKKITGRLSGIKLMLKVMPKTVQIERGATTVYTVSLVYEGSVAALIEESSIRPMIGHDRSLTPDQSITSEEETEIQQEFYPPTDADEISADILTKKAKEPAEEKKTEKREPTAAELARADADKLQKKQEKAKAARDKVKAKSQAQADAKKKKEEEAKAAANEAPETEQTEDTSEKPPIDEGEALDGGPPSDFGWV
ncbi:MAG: hypothetical protein BA864_11350 [Desulfuromonadales bacterium C00003093]|nr:MAG: hypothetical protein BA864_11350 [Desulfuromonadales bacterium C00003093]